MSAIEGVYFVLMFFSFFIIRKLNSGILNIGWFLLIFGLLINFLDVLMGEHFFYGGGIFIIPGIILVVIGVYRVITINNKKNKQLKKSEEEYKRVFESFQSVYYRTDIYKKIIVASPSIGRVLGYGPKEVKNIPFNNIFYDQKKYGDFLKKLRKAGRLDDYEIKLKKKNGEFLDTTINAHLVFDSRGAFLGVEGVIRDISKRKKALRALRESEEKYRTLVNNVNIGIYRSTDMKNNKFLQVNPAMVKIFGYDSMEEMKKIRVSDLYPNKEERSKIMEEIKKEGILKDKEIILKKKNGKHIIVSVTARSYCDVGGNFCWMDGVLEDITERKRTERQIKKNFDQQKLLASISIQLNQHGDFNKKINNVLKKIGEHMGISRVYIFEDSLDGKNSSNTFEWCAPKIEPQIKNLQNIPYSKMPGWEEILDQKGVLLADNISRLSPDLRANLESQNIKSILVLPLININGQRFGFMGLDEVWEYRNWDESEVNLMQTVASSISSVYERRKNNQQIQNQAILISEEKDRLNTIIQSIGDGVFVVDDKNQKPNRIFIEKVIKTGKTQKMMNHTMLITKKGFQIPVTDSAAPLRDKTGKVIGCVAVFHDVTRERKIEKIKTEFVSIASHQLKTPAFRHLKI